MRAYIYRAALYCGPCGEDIRKRVPLPPHADALNESSYDSDDWPMGPFDDGGGEADSPQHCDACGVFLRNPLTDDGREYVRGKLAPYIAPDDGEEPDPQLVADRATDDGRPALAAWIEFYGLPGA
jgi:hypothetical protein